MLRCTASLLLLALALPSCGRLREGDGGDGEIPDGCGAVPHRVTTLKARGGRVDWSRGNGAIAYDAQGDDGFFDVYTMALDGSRDTCLTCGRAGVPQRQNGNPAWHPSGAWVVYQSEVAGSRAPQFSTHPGRGVNNVLWIAEASGREFHPLTSLSGDSLGVLHPHFSHDGTRLAWSEMYEEAAIFEPGQFAGLWRLVMADFAVESGVPRLRNLRRFQPGTPGFYENHGFSPDGRRLLFSSNFGQAGLAQSINNDIYSLDLATLTATRLTREGYNEHAHYLPSGARIVWATNRDVANRGTDLWVMNPDGTGAERLTFFNQRGCPEATAGRSVPADNSPNSAGDKLLLYVQDEVLGERGSIVLVELDRPL
jgi:Tol biopolymer transport system component